MTITDHPYDPTVAGMREHPLHDYANLNHAIGDHTTQGHTAQRHSTQGTPTQGDIRRFADYRRARVTRTLTRATALALAVVALIAGTLLGLGRFAGWGPFAPSSTLPEAAYSADRWNLIVVNQWHRIPDAYPTPELVKLANGEQVDSRIYPDLQRMFDDMRAAGLHPEVTSGYRTHERQRQLFDEKRFLYENDGMSTAAATQEAKKWVAQPGTSEHELGLAVDINKVGARSTQDSVAEHSWLAANAWRYGFILRYPKNATAVTGNDYEPWHYRYVGQEAAKAMRESGVTLEEYAS
ncbi:M15 family metallopeptidase [Bifidobacterium leontopitheci]|uniref:D-Ala-D-Ala carboxypeptidase VanY n=1 Tax=Bifidobacterium leontopitheci TaxID=2650774 RepID=A0A6I1GN21_9BIFI|nr:M15 family metallopeptidase [Bifidobacterium leontopitheci]KAB7790809.1 D-Ala-D-Ala carboxypeptidase VanY [Bifidobacterium leontopitheci]